MFLALPLILFASHAITAVSIAQLLEVYLALTVIRRQKIIDKLLFLPDIASVKMVGMIPVLAFCALHAI